MSKIFFERWKFCCFGSVNNKKTSNGKYNIFHESYNIVRKKIKEQYYLNGLTNLSI